MLFLPCCGTVLLDEGHATLELDLLPQFSAERVLKEVMHPRVPCSLSSHLKEVGSGWHQDPDSAVKFLVKMEWQIPYA